ncbi:MAG TPA: DUF4403 family protein [Rhizomicrobium sp.]|nr:DUF4403 family protein [Rhizomicrobium sp.]
MRAFGRPLILSLVFAVGACGFDAPPPKRTPPPAPPPLPVSELTATLVVPIQTIIGALNDTTKEQIADIKDEPVNCTIAQCTLDLVATRTGPITGSASANRIAINVPVAATAQLQLKTSFFKTQAHSLATGAVHADTAVVLGSDWRLATDAHGTVDLSQAELKLGPIKMSFADLWNHNQQSLSAPIFKALDRHVASGIKIRPQAERLWLRAQRPIQVGKSPTAWLVLEPERIRIAQPQTRANAVVVAMGVDVRAHVVVSDTPPATQWDRALPAPAPLASPSDRFAFVVPVLLPYDQAANLAMQRLSKTPIKMSGGNVRFEKLEILPSGQDVVVAARFCVSQGWDPFGWLDSCGEAYLRGKPQFDAQTNTIRIANVHYDIATEGMIMSVMRFLAGDQLGKLLETKLVFNVGHDIDKLDTEVKTALAKPQGRGVVVSGAVQTFGKPSLTWTQEGFLATFPASGTIRADLNLKTGLPLTIGK